MNPSCKPQGLSGLLDSLSRCQIAAQELADLVFIVESLDSRLKAWAYQMLGSQAYQLVGLIKEAVILLEITTAHVKAKTCAFCQTTGQGSAHRLSVF